MILNQLSFDLNVGQVRRSHLHYIGSIGKPPFFIYECHSAMSVLVILFFEDMKFEKPRDVWAVI